GRLEVAHRVAVLRAGAEREVARGVLRLAGLLGAHRLDRVVIRGQGLVVRARARPSARPGPPPSLPRTGAWRGTGRTRTCGRCTRGDDAAPRPSGRGP